MIVRDLRAPRVPKRGTFISKKRSTPFHKEILPTFTKQLRKNYTIICSSIIESNANISNIFSPRK